MDPIAVFNQSPIKGTFVSHFMLITWALITTDWMPTVFLLYNAFFFLALFWSLATPQNSEPVQLAAIINLLSILLDLMCIATNYGRYHFQDWFGFSLFLLIINLILRGITSIVLLRIYNDRNDRFGTYGGAGVFGSGSDRAPFLNSGGSSGHHHRAAGYQDIDSQAPTAVLSGGSSPSNGPPMQAAALSGGGGNNTAYQSVPSPIHSQQQLIDAK